MHSVVLVRPRYQLNVGLAARAMKNFGFKDLVLVKPTAKKGFRMRMFAKHSEEIIADARVVGSLQEAVEGCDVVVGSTGVLNRFRDKLKNCVSLEEAVAMVGRRKAALVFGSEGNGLGEDEVNACDIVMHIPVKPAHPILNLSHAVAVTLYAFSRAKAVKLYDAAPAHKRRRLEEMFAEIVSGLGSVKNKEKVSDAFKRVLERGDLADDEAQALFAAFSGILKTK